MRWTDGFTVHPAYAQYSSYEDKLDTKRTAAVKRDWWKAILVQLEANGGVVTAIMNERLARYTQSARSTEVRKIYGDRRRSGARKKGSVGTTVLGAEEGQVVNDSAEVEGDLELQVLEEVTDVVASKKTHTMKAHSLAVDGEDGHPPCRSTGCRYHSFWLNLGKFAKARLDSWMNKIMTKRALAACVALTWS